MVCNRIEGMDRRTPFVSPQWDCRFLGTEVALCSCPKHHDFTDHGQWLPVTELSFRCHAMPQFSSPLLPFSTHSHLNIYQKNQLPLSGQKGKQKEKKEKKRKTKPCAYQSISIVNKDAHPKNPSALSAPGPRRAGSGTSLVSLRDVTSE